MTTFWKSHCHFASNGIDLAEFWALYQKIIAPEVDPPSKKCFDQLNNHLNYHKNGPNEWRYASSFIQETRDKTNAPSRPRQINPQYNTKMNTT
jgi:hypothetical protein